MAGPAAMNAKNAQAVLVFWSSCQFEQKPMMHLYQRTFLKSDVQVQREKLSKDVDGQTHSKREFIFLLVKC